MYGACFWVHPKKPYHERIKYTRNQFAPRSYYWLRIWRINPSKTVEKQTFSGCLLDKHNYHTFQPLLYQVATAGLEPDSIAYPIRKIFKNQENFFFRMCTANSIDSAQKTVETSLGSLHYDYLVIATGSDTNYFGNKKIEALAMPMKTVPEALNLRSLILQNFEDSLLTADLKEQEGLMNYVIVGGGPTGVELAGALAELKNHVLPNDYPDLDIRKMNIHLVEASGSLLAAMSKQSQEKSAKFLKNLGVQVWLNTLVKDYDGKVVETNKKAIPTKTLIWAAGVKGNIIKGLPEQDYKNGRYLVNEFNKLQSVDCVFAIGDVALMGTQAKPKGDPMVAQTAIQQGALLAKNLQRIVQGKKTKAFSYNDKGSMATVGRNLAVVDIGGVRFQGAFAWFIWMFIHLIALVGFRNRLIALNNWLVNYFSYDKGIRLIIRPFKRFS